MPNFQLNLQPWDWVLLVIGGYIALSSLLRLMRSKRDQLLAELTAQAALEQQRQRLAKQIEKQRKKKAA